MFMQHGRTYRLDKPLHTVAAAQTAYYFALLAKGGITGLAQSIAHI